MSLAAPVHVPPTQSEILFDPSQQGITDLTLHNSLISSIQRELGQKKRFLLRITANWVIAYEQLKLLHADCLDRPTPPKILASYVNSSLITLRGLGHHLVDLLKANEEIDIDGLGLTFFDLEACVAELDYLDFAENSDMTPAMKEELDQRFTPCASR